MTTLTSIVIQIRALEVANVVQRCSADDAYRNAVAWRRLVQRAGVDTPPAYLRLWTLCAQAYEARAREIDGVTETGRRIPC
jgi:hypothetical protein